ncbi:MAG: outer membrane protein assembly factor BamA [Candidatus Marinimicrobia bacterium]|nr:outer membrane protein assembly factor BamA [Candidatus Neomarinimicrobiota bacterium]MCF7921848.1 outer membrane protein assembly factor BamA [Candidatus Neomarinimicrobiota bacterium]
MRQVLIVLLLTLSLPVLILPKNKNQFKIHKVEFTGNKTYKDDALHKVIMSRPSRLFFPVIYNEDIFVDDLDGLKNFYQRRGFLKMDIPDYNVLRDSAKMRVNIQLTLEEGERTVIDAISYLGNTSIPDSILVMVSGIKDNDPFDADVIEKAQLTMLRYYADRGYLEAEVKPSWSLDSWALHAILDFDIDAGQQYRVGDIRIKGLEKTIPGVVIREVTLKPGEIVSYSKILKSQRNLYLTGLFESVFIDPEINQALQDTAKQDLVIGLKENQAGAFNISFGYGSVEGLRAKSEFTQNNVKGTAKKIGLTGQISHIQRLIVLSHTNPRIRDSFWRMDASLKYDLQFQPVYDLESYAWGLAVQRQLDQFISVTFSLRDEFNQLSNVKLDTLSGEGTDDVHSLKLRLSRDTRNNLFNPKQGSLIEWENEVAGGPVTSSNSFYRSIFKARWFKPVLDNSVFGSAIEAGFVTSLSGNLTISLQERFYSGGPSSLRGYAYREVGPHDLNNNAKGGFYKLIWNVFELRIPVYKDFSIATFSDIGNVWWDYHDISKGKWAVDYGVGFHYNTPIGVVRVDIGFPVGNIPVNDRVRFNFSMGYAF